MFTARLISFALILLFTTSLPAAAQDRNIERCLSISDVNERIDCLESGGTARSTGTPSTPAIRSPKQPHAGPSFDCRVAGNSIERAICADATLSEWDYRMGQQYQHAVRSRKDSDTQLIVESQRAWVLQRNARCNAFADTAVVACVLDMTRQRIDVLVKLIVAGSETVPTAQSQNTTQAATKNPTGAVTAPSGPANPSTLPPPRSIPSTNAATEGTNSFLIVLLVGGALISGAIVVGNINRKKRLAAEAEAAQRRLAEEHRRRAEERERLVANYGESIADGILAHKVWQGMTEEQLLLSWGQPEDRDTEIKRATKKETWKYREIGKNRFSDRVFLENGIVIGWKQQ